MKINIGINRHVRGKSDTKFHEVKRILESSSSGLKNLRKTLFTKVAKTIRKKNLNESERTSPSSSKSESEKLIPEDIGSIQKMKNAIPPFPNHSSNDDFFYLFLEKVLLFKKELDYIFFENEINSLKFCLDNLAEIIKQNIYNLKVELVIECPLVENHILINTLEELIEVIDSFIGTKTQLFYHEIKTAIIEQWNKNRQKIIKIFKTISKENSLENSSLNNENIINSYLLKKKKVILNLMSKIYNEFLFSLSELYYEIDSYSLIISSLVLKIFYVIMSFINKNREQSIMAYSEKLKQYKILHIIEHILLLVRTYYKNGENSEIFSEYGGLNSASLFILNNIVNFVAKCQNIILSLNDQKFPDSTLYQKTKTFKHYKYYLYKYKNDKHLLKMFGLYYNSKLAFWKSRLILLEDKKTNKICCRVCEKKIPLNEFIFHSNYCKEQKINHRKSLDFKEKLYYFIQLLECYRFQISEGTSKKGNNILCSNNNFLSKGNKDKLICLKNLIDIFLYEKEKSCSYYEKRPEQIKYLISLSYLSLILYISNKVSNEADDDKLSNIFGGIFSLIIEKFVNFQFLQYIKQDKTKNNSFNSISLNFCGPGNYKSNEKPYFNDNISKFGADNNRRTSINLRKIEESDKKVNASPILSPDKSFKSLLDRCRNQLVISDSLISSSSSENQYNKEYSIQENNIKNSNNNDKFQKNFIENEKKFYSSSLSKTQNSFKGNNYINEKQNILPSNNIKINLSGVIENSHSNSLNFSSQNKNCPKISDFEKNNSNIGDISLSEQESKSYNINDSTDKNNNEKLSFSSVNGNNSLNEETYSLFSESFNITFPTFNDRYNNYNIMETRDILSKCLLNKKDNKSVKPSLFSIKQTNKDSKNDINNEIHNENNNENEKVKEENELIIELIDNICKDSDIDNSLEEEYQNLCVFNLNEKGISKTNDKNNTEFLNEENKINFLQEKENTKVDSFCSSLFLCPKKSQLIKEYKVNDIIKELKKNIDSEEGEYEGTTADSFLSNQKETEIMKTNEKRNILNNIYKNKFDKFKEDNLAFFNNNIFADNETFKRKKSNNLLQEKKEINDFTLCHKKNEDNSNLLNINSNNTISINNEESHKISSFKLVLPLAKGGYGSVSLYKKISTGDYYAIKTVDIDKMKERKLFKTLKHEQNILAQITSDYVVNSYFIFKDSKYYYFVMEYLPGGDVYNLLSYKLTEPTIQLITAELILGINYLHQVKIIHHDVKPENILITATGHFKLVDFGLSKIMKTTERRIDKYVKKFQEFSMNKNDLSSSEDEGEEKEDMAVGTLNYMAPELFTDEYEEDESIDYWAVGVVLYELYSFKVPFEGKTPEETRNNIINVNINWDNLDDPEIKNSYQKLKQAKDLIKKFLVKYPKDRWGDKNLEEIKSHPFFEGLNWEEIQKIRRKKLLDYLKNLVEKTKEKMKEFSQKNKENSRDSGNNNISNDFPFTIDIEMTENEKESDFTERLDNLNRRNNEIIKMKFKKKEFHFNEDNEKDMMLYDLK